MRAAKTDVPVADEGGGYEGRFAQWGRYAVAFETIPSGSDFGPLLKGLPGDACQCPHWGYCFTGSFVVHYTDGEEETVRSGEAYSMRPGHRPVYVENTETLEFSPHDELEKVMEVVARNMQAAEPEKTET